MKNRPTIAFSIFAARLSLILLIGATVLEIVLMITANMGAVWYNELRRLLLESVFLVLVFLSVGTLIVSMMSRKIVKPFHDLQHAIHEVSKGNFNISIEYNQNDEFREVVKCFNQMVIELDGIQMMQNDIINIFSHECKTPISSILGFAKQLQRNDLSEEEREEYLQIIVSESERLMHLYQNILNLSRYQNQEILTNQEQFSLDEQIRKCILLLKKEWERKELQLEIELEEVDFYGNEEMMSQVWINILSNAIKFTSNGGCISIKCQKSKKGIIVSIQDDGVGMDHQTKEKMFDKFYYSTANDNKGNGIGLAIVKRIIELCEGEIFVESTEGEGTEVIVEVPCEL